MDEGAATRMLAARVQLAAPAARCLLVAGARRDIDVSTVVQSLVAGFQAGRSGAVVQDVREDESGFQATGHSAGADTDYTILRGSGILDDPATLQAVAIADAIILVVKRGSTTRRDLEECRLELESVGAILLGAVLVG